MKNPYTYLYIFLVSVILLMVFDTTLSLCDDTVNEEGNTKIESEKNNKYLYLAGFFFLGIVIIATIYYFFSGGPTTTSPVSDLNLRQNVIKELKTVSIELLPKIGVDISNLYTLTLDMPRNNFIRNIHLYYNFIDYIEELYRTNSAVMAEYENITRYILDIKKNIKSLPETVTWEEFILMVNQRREMILNLGTTIDDIRIANHQFIQKTGFQP